MENKMKYLQEKTPLNKIDKLTKLFDDLVLEFNSICKNSFEEISSNSNLQKICDQIDLIKNNIFSIINNISKKNGLENVFKRLTKNLSKNEKDFFNDAYKGFNSVNDEVKEYSNSFFNYLSQNYDSLIIKKNNFLRIANNNHDFNNRNTLLLDLDSEIKTLEKKINIFTEQKKYLYLNLTNSEKQNINNKKEKINKLNLEISSYFSVLKNNSVDIKDDLHLYIEKLNKMNKLYLELKSKFDSILKNKDFFSNLKAKKNLSTDEKYEIIDLKVNQIKWEYNFKLFEIKSSFDTKIISDESISHQKLDKIIFKIKEIEDIIYSLLNEKSEYLKKHLKFFITHEKQGDNVSSQDQYAASEKILEKKVDFLEKQLMQQLGKINNDHSSLLLNMENKINNLSNELVFENIESKFSSFSSDFKELISNMSKELNDIKEKLSTDDNKPNFDIDLLSEKIDQTLKSMENKNIFNNKQLEEFISSFSFNFKKSLDETITKIESQYKEDSHLFRSEIIGDSQKYKEDVLSQVSKMLKTNLEESNSLVDKLSSKIVDFKNDHKHFVRENNKVIFSILKKNENEKKAIKDLLKQISAKNHDISDEAQINKLFFHNSKLLQLDELIKSQNDSFLNLLNDKEKIYFEVEKILLNKNKSEKGEDKLKRIESEINNIKIIINSKIESVEKSFKEKFNFINKDYIDEIQVTNKNFSNDFELAIFNHINGIENKLLDNFSDIKQNILSVVSQVYSEVESIKKSSLTLPELDSKLANLASKIDEIKIIEQAESVTKFNFEEIKTMLANTNLSIEEKLSQINSLQNNFSKNISNELHSAFSENSQNFLNDIKKTLNENTNDAMSSLDDRFFKFNEDGKKLPQKISTELISLIDQNNEKFLEQLNKSLKDSKLENIDISNKIYSEISKFRNDQSIFVERNRNWFRTIIENNEKNKFYIKKLLNQINDKNEELALELQASKLTSQNTKLLELENLINKQTFDVSSLMDEKTKVFDEVERILTTKKDAESNADKLKRIEFEISKILNNINSKIDNTEKSIMEKFDYINKDYINEMQVSNKVFKNDFEIAIYDHINGIENKLIDNFSDIKQNINSLISEVSNEIEAIKNSSLSLPELEEKLAILASKIDEIKNMDKHNLVQLNFDEIKTMLTNTNVSMDEKLSKINSIHDNFSKDISSEINSVLSQNSQHFLNDVKKTLAENNNDTLVSLEDKLTSFDDKLSRFSEEGRNLPQKISNELFSILDKNNELFFNQLNQSLDINKTENLDISNKIYTEISKFRNDQSIFVERNRNWFRTIIENNEKNKYYIKKLLDQINDKNEELALELQASKLTSQNTKLLELENLINKQTFDVSSLMDEKTKVFDEIERILTTKKDAESNADKLKRIEFEISKILNNINSKIDNTEKSIMDKFDYINKDYINEIQVSNKVFKNDFEIAIYDHINGIENKLIDNFSDIKQNINSLISEVSNEIEAIKNSSLSLPELEEKLAILASKIDEIKNMDKHNLVQLNFDEIKTMLTNTNVSMDEKLSKINSMHDNFSKDISSEINSVLNQNSQHFLNDVKKTLTENNDNTLVSFEDKFTSFDDRLSKFSEEGRNLPQKISNELFSVLDKNNELFFNQLNQSLDINKTENLDISNKIYSEISKFRNEQLIFVERNRNWFKTIIENNEKNKYYIKKLLDQINDKNEELALELQASKLTSQNSKLLELEDLIDKQNFDVSSLLDEKKIIYDEIERILTTKKDKENNEDKLIRIESEISDIKNVINLKIDSTEKSLMEKFDFINRDYIKETQVLNKIFTSDFEIAIYDHISGIENKLLNNFSDIKHNIISLVSEVYSEIESIKNSSLSLPELDEKLAILASKIDDIKTIEQESVISLNFDEIKKILSNTNDSINEIKSTDETKAMDQQNKIQLNFDEIKNILTNTNLSIDERLSKIDSMHVNFSKDISSELFSVLNQNSQYFLNDVKKTLVENSNDTLISLEDKLTSFDDKLSRFSEEGKILPEKISNEIYSVLDKNNENFFVELNKSLEVNKHENVDISNKIYYEINKFRNEQLNFIEKNKNWFRNIVENNSKNRFYIKKLLDQINNKNDELDLEMQTSKLTFHNSKLFELESLITKQTEDVSLLLDEKTLIYDEIEKILISKKEKENNIDKIKRIESEILIINSNFSNKFKQLEKNLINKFNSLNKQYINEIESESYDDINLSKDIFNNINKIENKLLENFDSIKLNIASSIMSIFQQIEFLKNNTFSESDIDNKLSLLAKEIKDLKNIESLISRDNKINDATTLDELNANYKKIANDLYIQISNSYKKNNKNLLYKIDKEFFKNDKLFYKEYNDSKKIEKQVYAEINKFRDEQKEYIIKNAHWFQEIISNNCNDSNHVSKLLEIINEQKENIFNESQIIVLDLYKDKLVKLNEIITEENQLLIELLISKEQTYESIQHVLISKKNETHEEKIQLINQDIDNISYNFILKINQTKEVFSTKFSNWESINKETETNANISQLEKEIHSLFSRIKSRLFNNFDLVNNNVYTSISSISKQIKEIIRNSQLEKEMRNKFFHLSQQIQDIKGFEFSIVLGNLSIENKFSKIKGVIDRKIDPSLSSDIGNDQVPDKLKEILNLYNIKSIDEILKVSDFFYEFEKQKNELTKSFGNSLEIVYSHNNKLIGSLNNLYNNSNSLDIVHGEMVSQFSKLIDEQTKDTNSVYLYRISLLDKLEANILYIASKDQIDENELDKDLLNVQNFINGKLNNLLAEINIIKNNNRNNAVIEEILFYEKSLVENLNNLKEILLNNFNYIKSNATSFREYLKSFSKLSDLSHKNIKKMSNILNYDLKLIDDISMKNIIVLENKRNEIINFYRKLRDLGNKH